MPSRNVRARLKQYTEKMPSDPNWDLAEDEKHHFELIEKVAPNHCTIAWHSHE